MDVFEPGHQFGDFDFQLNDHNPGVSELGLFWTAQAPNDSVATNFAEGSATFCLTDIQMPDLHDLLTALWGGGEFDGEGQPLAPVFSSTVFVQARWFNAGSIEQLRDSVNRFVYNNAQIHAQVKWKSARR